MTPPSPLLRWLAAAALVVALAGWCVSRHYPTLPNPLTLDFILDPTKHGNQSDPIITAGVRGKADFLYLHRADPGVIFIGYDSWNSDRANSPRIALEPGTRHRLRIEMPGLNQVQGRFTDQQPGRVRVWLDDALVLDARVHFYVRAAHAIQIGENTLGGTSAEASFGGTLYDESGREIRGIAGALFTPGERLRGWLREAPGQVLALLALGVVLGRFGAALRPGRLLVAARAGAAAARRHRSFTATAAGASAIFAWFITIGSFDFGYAESFCTFYDFQARSLLQGRLDVPEECLSGEAFVVDGKYYGYFGITPALLRLPFALFDLGLGRLSRGFMLFHYAGALLAAYLIFLTARRLAHGDTVPPPRPWITFLLVANVGLGSTLLFVGSRAYIYHEAILAGVSLALFSAWCALRYWSAPASRWWLGALVCGVLSVHARPPTGLFALTLLGSVALAHLRPRPAESTRPAGTPAGARVRRFLLVGTLCAAGLLSFNGLAYLKFNTFDGQPLRYNANYSAERLAKFGEKKFQAGNVPYVAQAYLFGPAFTLEPGFPWFLADPKPTWRPAWTRMDMIEPTVGFPFAMPGLWALATLGAFYAWRTRPAIREAIALLALSILPMAAFLFAAIAVSHRYTADFVPWLVGLAAFGLAAVETAPIRRRRGALAVLGAATLWAVPVTAALTLHHQREQLWGVPEEVRRDYQQLRERVDRFFGREPTPPP